ncbi:MAG: VOC family protein [Actinobacteria bacterium]|nr:VOC family protein [Actinomycetota bacterium]
MDEQPRRTGFHHVAYACRDAEATRHFYEDLLGMPLVHTEVKAGDEAGNGGFFRHLFFDTGDGTCIAFFEVQGVGERDDYATEISTGNGLPVWVNHVAFAADEERVRLVEERMAADDIVPLMEVDHGWCVSLYFLDPNGIMVEFCRDTGGFGEDPGSARDRIAETEGTDTSSFLRPLDPAGLRGFDPFPTQQDA